jgi:hypothetical protein
MLPKVGRPQILQISVPPRGPDDPAASVGRSTTELAKWHANALSWAQACTKRFIGFFVESFHHRGDFFWPTFLDPGRLYIGIAPIHDFLCQWGRGK